MLIRKGLIAFIIFILLFTGGQYIKEQTDRDPFNRYKENDIHGTKTMNEPVIERLQPREYIRIIERLIP